MRLLLIAFTALAIMLPLQATAQSQSGWISDVLFVPLRAGAGNQYRIVHRGLRSGTPIRILDWPEDAEWVHVQVGENEGWIQAQYISRTPIAATRLADQERRGEQLEGQLREAREQLNSVTRERNELAQRAREQTGSLESQGAELERLKELAADPVRLDEANRRLNEELSLLRSELDQAQAENALLRNDRTFQGWLLALATVFGGMLLGWYFKSRSSQKRSSWT